jgi:hypothetical protein
VIVNNYSLLGLYSIPLPNPGVLCHLFLGLYPATHIWGHGYMYCNSLVQLYTVPPSWGYMPLSLPNYNIPLPTLRAIYCYPLLGLYMPLTSRYMYCIDRHPVQGPYAVLPPTPVAIYCTYCICRYPLLGRYTATRSWGYILLLTPGVKCIPLPTPKAINVTHFWLLCYPHQGLLHLTTPGEYTVTHNWGTLLSTSWIVLCPTPGLHTYSASYNSGMAYILQCPGQLESTIENI